MDEMGLKQDVLQEIIDLMEEREGNDLKKHPKLMAAQIEVEKPEVEAGQVAQPQNQESEEITPEQIEKLIAHFKGL